MATVALAGVTELPTPEQLKPKPKLTTMEVKSEPVTLGAGANAPASKLPFDPVALKNKYLEERDKRLRANTEGVNQYRMVEGSLSHFIEDPYLKEIIKRDPIDEEVDVVIIGGGYGAQLVAVRLQEAGIKNFRILEKGGDFGELALQPARKKIADIHTGGTWYWNRYPGAQCDIESYVYMPLLDEIDYVPTEKYARAKELLEHAEMIGKRYGLYEKTLFQTEVKGLRWDETTARWTAETSRGDTIRASFAIPAAGPLHRPKLPGLAGIESYKGHSFHSSRWDYEYTGGDPTGGLKKLKDKRVGIIGTGATAVQIVPHLAASAAQTVVFQRTPSSIDVRGNRPTDLQWVSTLDKGWQKSRMDNLQVIRTRSADTLQDTC
jgi:cation diffusion facilitator CzcD-associated flavoprotein CzcO